MRVILLILVLTITINAQQLLIYKESIQWVSMDKAVFLMQYTDDKTSHNIISHYLISCGRVTFVVMDRYEFIPLTSKLLRVKPSNKIEIATFGSPERKAMEYVCQTTFK
jgi:hypothetical protein